VDLRIGKRIVLALLVRGAAVSGELVRLKDETLTLRDAYYVVVPHGRSITPTIESLINLLRKAAGVA
jgi:DNA-binding transcriptional LysR family regulator